MANLDGDKANDVSYMANWHMPWPAGSMTANRDNDVVNGVGVQGSWDGVLATVKEGDVTKYNVTTETVTWQLEDDVQT